MIVKDIMKNQVYTIHQERSLSEACRKMRSHNCGCLLVEGRGKILGIITDRDIAVRGVATGINTDMEKVKSHMSLAVKYCFEDDSVDDASKIMMQNRVRRLPVLDKKKRMIGIVTLTDLALHLGDSELVSKTMQRISA